MLGTTKCAVNFRNKAEKGDNLIKIIPKGHTVNILEEKDVPEGWLKVKVGRKTGYMMAEFVEAHSKTGEEVEGKIDKDGNFLVDGEVVGKVDGENITITDPEIITETLADVEEGEGNDK